MKKFFLTYESRPYRFINQEIAKRHKQLTNRPVGAVVLHEIIDIVRPAGINVPITVRSKYTPEMLIEPCRKFERGGRMGSFDKKILAQAYHRVKRKFRVREKLQPLPLAAVPYDGSKNSGLPYLTRKEDVYELTIARAERVQAGEILPPPTVMFHRGKNEEVARPVFALPFEQHLIEGRFFYPLQEQWKSGYFPYCVGVRPAMTGMKVNDIYSSTHLLGFDYSGYDGSISAKLIHMAFDIIHSCFELTPHEEKIFNHIVCYFITAAVLAPDGRVYKGRRHGVPSGSMFTQMIDSLVNAIIIEYSAQRLNVKGLRYLVLGDDSLVGFASGTTDLHQWAAMMKELGISMSPTKSDNFKEKPVHFLGQDWERGVPGKDLYETLSKLACPERIRAEYFSSARSQAILERVNAYIDTNGNFETNDVLRKLAYCLEHGGDLANMRSSFWRPSTEHLSMQKAEYITGRAQYDEEFRRELQRNTSRMIRPAIVL